MTSTLSLLLLVSTSVLVPGETPAPAAMVIPPVQRHLVVYPLPHQDGLRIDREHGVVLVRWRSAIYAYALADGGTDFGGVGTMDRLDIERTGNAVTVDLGVRYRRAEDPAAWNAAMVLLD
jgi:hypothetical protein